MGSRLKIKWAQASGLTLILALLPYVAHGQTPQPQLVTPVTLTIAQFVDLALNQSFTALQYQHQQTSERLLLTAAENTHLPQLSLTSEVGKERKNTYSTAYQDHYQEGIEGGVNMAWTLPTGANLSASYTHEYGRALGLQPLGVSTDYRRTEVTSAELTQPLLQRHPIDQQRLPIEAARLQWQAYEAQGHLLNLGGVRDALLGVVDYQSMVDQVALNQQAVEYSHYRVQVAQNLLLAGRVTQSEVSSAELDWYQRQGQLLKVQGDLQLLLGRLSSQLQVGYTVDLQPMPSMVQLTQCLAQGEGKTLGVNAHPQMTQASAQVSRLQKQHQLTRYDLWPKANLFYRYSGTHSSTVEDTIERSVGISFSYTPTQWQTRANQAISRNTWLNARYDLDATRKTLENENYLRSQQQQLLERQSDLALQLVALAEKTYGQQLLRFEEGVASAASVRDAHNQWQETQMSLLDEHTQWLQNRIHLNYAQGREIHFLACLP
jgi:outer membrane protein TolC